MNHWDTCVDQWTLGLFCRHGHHHKECTFYTKSQMDKTPYVREDTKSKAQLYLDVSSTAHIRQVLPDASGGYRRLVNKKK